MKRIFTLILAVTLISVYNTESFGQNAKLRYADRQMELSNYLDAVNGYKAAYNKKPTYRAAKGIASASQHLRNYEEMYFWWKTVTDFGEASADDFLYYIAAANQIGKLEEVMEAIDSVSLIDPSPVQNLHLDSLNKWYSNAKNMEILLLADINTSATEYGISMDKTGNTYFSSDRGNVPERKKKAIRIDGSDQFYDKESDWTGRDFIGIYKMNPEGELSRLSSPVPDTYHFSDPVFLEQMPLVFYTVSRKSPENTKRVKDFTVYPEIFYSTVNEGGQWLDFKPFPFNAATSYGVLNPFVDEKSKRVYFSSNKPGGYGGYDLYYVTYDEKLNFSQPVNLGEKINTTGDEGHPYMHESKFYFSSNGHFGLGGLDIFESRYASEGFSDVRNLGLPYNSPQDDFSVYHSPEGMKYLSSNRLDGLGLDDIYQIIDLYRRFVGKVVDCDGNLVMEPFEVEMLQKSDSLNIFTKTGDNGIITADIAPDSDFELKIKKKGYFSIHDDRISTRGLDSDILEKEYRMTRIPFKTTVFVDLIYYDLDKSVIREDARPIMTKIGDLMKQYTFMDILVRSHTDSRASNEYNKELSRQRAGAVKDFLGDYGIAQERVKEEWLGEEELANDCGDGVPCPEKAHQLNRRSELILTAFPDENQDYDFPEELKGMDLCEEENLLMSMDTPTLYFDFDQSGLRVEDEMELERVALLLNRIVSLKLGIEGHTDNRGTDEYNNRLSEKRAKVAGDYLVKKGIDPARLSHSFYGKTRPVQDCLDKTCDSKAHQLNRRTELKLIKKLPGWK